MSKNEIAQLEESRITVVNQQRSVFWAVLLLIAVVIFLVATLAWKIGFRDHDSAAKPGLITIQVKAGTADEDLKKAIEAVNERRGVIEEQIQSLGNRINDIGVSAQIVGVGSGVFGVLLTVLVLYFQLNEKERIELTIRQIVERLKDDVSNLEGVVSNAGKQAEKASSTADQATVAAANASAAAKTASAAAQTASNSVADTNKKMSAYVRMEDFKSFVECLSKNSEDAKDWSAKFDMKLDYSSGDNPLNEGGVQPSKPNEVGKP